MIVLNSLSYLNQVIESISHYNKVNLCLDYGKAGDNAIHDIGENWIPEPLQKTAELEQKLGYFEQAAIHYERYIYLKDSF